MFFQPIFCFILYSLTRVHGFDLTELGQITSDGACLGSVHQVDAVNGETMVAAMRRGYWECAKSIVAMSQTRESATDLRMDFDKEHRTILKEMSSLKTVIESTLPMASVSPAFQWAQSPTEILLNVKFSHKIDAPATLNVEAQNVTILEDRLLLKASDGRKNFNLDLTFFEPIVPSDSRYDMASVGRMTFNLKKKGSPSKWNYLLKSKQKVPHMHLWWEMQEKYTKELEQLDDDETPKKSEKKSNKKSKKAASLTTDDNPSSGRIVSPAEQAINDQVKAIDDDATTKIKKIDDEARSKKVEIDNNAKEEKKRVDADALARRLEVERIANAAKEKLKRPENGGENGEL